MSNIKIYKDIIAFHPGYYINEIIESMEISQDEFAKRIGITTNKLNCLINGEINVSNNMAYRLSEAIGTSSKLWINLQNTYDKKMMEIRNLKGVDNE